MLDAPSSESALDGVTPYRGNVGVLTMAEHGLTTLLHLEGARPGPELTTILANLALTALPAIGESGGRADAMLLSIGPSMWLLVAPAGPPKELTTASATGGAFEVALDVSHAYGCIEIAGDKASELLAKGCVLDLHLRHFPPGACAATGLWGIRTIIRHLPDRFHVLVTRSYAHSLWLRLLDAGREYWDPSNDSEAQ